MSDSHGPDGHGGGEKKSSGGGDRSFMADRFLGRIFEYISDGIGKLIAFILIMITVGALIGYYISYRHWDFLLVFVPAGLGIIAYYERDIAIILFAALLLLVVF